MKESRVLEWYAARHAEREGEVGGRRLKVGAFRKGTGGQGDRERVGAPGGVLGYRRVWLSGGGARPSQHARLL